MADKITVVPSPNKPRPNDSLVTDLADALWRTARNYDREGSGPGSRFEGRLLEDVQAELAVRTVRDADAAITAERDRYAAQLAVITVALRDIAGAYDTGTMAHDVAQAALDALGDTGRTRSAADLAAALREIEAVCREDDRIAARERVASIARTALDSSGAAS